MRQLLSASLIAVFAGVIFQATVGQGGPIDSGCGSNHTNNFFFGSRVAYDRVLFSDHYEFRSPWKHTVHLEADFPPRGSTMEETINFIAVLDQRHEGTGCVSIKNGGIGRKFVTLEIRTGRNQKMDYLVYVFGQ